jgi:crotonobetainyl-CoA:carnitine CoA-transferase CaiB-like acyl-CoA transferase
MANRDAAGVPKSTGFLTADYATALYVFQALAAAIAGRAHEREGRYLDISLMHASGAFLAMKIVEERLEGGAAPKLNAPAGSYRSKDGWIGITLTKEAHFGALCRAIGRPALAEDPRFADFALRSKHLAELTLLVQEPLLGRTTAEWLDVFRAADVLASRIHGFSSWLEDPQVRVMELVSEEALPGLPPVPWVKIPGALPLPSGDARRRWPDIGEDGASILRDVLGLPEREIAAFREQGTLLGGSKRG